LAAAGKGQQPKANRTRPTGPRRWRIWWDWWSSAFWERRSSPRPASTT